MSLILPTELPAADRVDCVLAFIETNWAGVVRTNTRDEGTLIGLPFPYTIPSRKDSFQELYYWDTYFTCLGLLETGHHELAMSNTRNLLALLDRFGFVPNGNRTFYLTRSQPPYLAPLVWQVGSALKDPDFIAKAVPSLLREYGFWTTQRTTSTGLSRHGHHADRQGLIDFFDEIVHRGALDGRRAEDCLDEISQLMTECETGWDLNHRFEHRCSDFCPVDLNSSLFLYEKFFAEFAAPGERETWRQRAEARKQKINELCWDEDQGAFFDWNHAENRRGSMISVANFDPLWSGLATPEQARRIVEKTLPRLEFAHGIAACAPGPRHRVCQWDYPNAWPCVQNLTYRGLAYYGFNEGARRVATKYISTVTRCFEKTGDLWEKYNAVNGTVNTPSETGYNASAVREFDRCDEHAALGAPPAMMGWTAGVYIDAVAFVAGWAAPLAHQTPA
jgi:alpha,alpha-trehalase